MGLKQSYKALGPLRFFSLIAAVVGWIAIDSYLSIKLDWPDSFGFHCGGRGCLIEELWFSPRLLRYGGFYADALFAQLWAIIVIPVGFVLWKKRKAMRFNIFAERQVPDEQGAEPSPTSTEQG